MKMFKKLVCCTIIMSFNCGNCEMKFKSKQNLNYHLTKKVCHNDKIFECKYCKKCFVTNGSMYRHIQKTCKIIKEENNNKNVILERLIRLEEDNIKMKKDNERIKKENDKLKKEMKKIKCENKTVTNNTINNVPINNGTINNGTINNIVLIGYGKEDLAKIDREDMLKSLKKGFYSTLHLTETVHFNPKYPEYHNVYISNIRDKYAMMYDGMNWTLTRKTELIDRLYEDKKNYIEDNMEEFIESLTESQIKALQRWLDTDDNHERIKEIKDKIKLLLYNQRDLIINSKDE